MSSHTQQDLSLLKAPRRQMNSHSRYSFKKNKSKKKKKKFIRFEAGSRTLHLTHPLSKTLEISHLKPSQVSSVQSSCESPNAIPWVSNPEILVIVVRVQAQVLEFTTGSRDSES